MCQPSSRRLVRTPTSRRTTTAAGMVRCASAPPWRTRSTCRSRQCARRAGQRDDTRAPAWIGAQAVYLPFGHGAGHDTGNSGLGCANRVPAVWSERLQAAELQRPLEWSGAHPHRPGELAQHADLGNVLDGQVNVTTRERQPGSALKPFTYLSAMEQGMTPGTVVWDVPTEFPPFGPNAYKPQNYNGRWNGPVRIRTALANSLNMPISAMCSTGRST